MTYKKMCETIAKAINKIDPQRRITPEEIWEISPTGELWPIRCLYEIALKVLDG